MYLLIDILRGHGHKVIRFSCENMYRTYTSEDAPEAISCQETLNLYVERFVSARERVRRILNGVRDIIKRGLEKGVSRRKLLHLINASEEMKDKQRITESQFARYCREEFSELGSERNKNGTPRKNTGFGQMIEEKLERKGARV